MKLIKIIILVLLFTSCAPILVNYDYDNKTDFTLYKTYNYYSDLNTGLSELDENRLLDAIDITMKLKGLELSDNPDFLIDIKTGEFQGNSQSTVGVGLGGTGRNVGGGISVGIPIGQSLVNRQIIIDFIDDNKNGLFWQVVSESSYNPKAKPEQRELKFKAIIDKALSKYPPKQE
ncbi:DUF4136 domain-containing protein [Flavobacteriaceae bacterium AU392]|nr:DUF4136 domain-containing protein [Flavobacteriaceae bacterium]RKM81380.1 DUF4136 domain-containing protein [Flavobacteriaceae bacterium AU392]